MKRTGTSLATSGLSRLTPELHPTNKNAVYVFALGKMMPNMALVRTCSLHRGFLSCKSGLPGRRRRGGSRRNDEDPALKPGPPSIG